MEPQRLELPSDTRYGGVHPLEVCHLFSLPLTVPCKERLAGLKDGCGGVFLFWNFSEGVGYCRDATVPAWTVSRWKEKEVFFFHTSKCRNMTAFLFMWRCFKKKKRNQPDNQIPFRSKLFIHLLVGMSYFCSFWKKSPRVSGMSVASNIVCVVCYFIYLTRPSAPKAPNSTSLCAKTESIVSKNWIVPHDSFQTESVRLSMSCAVFSDRAEELRPCSWGFSLIQRVLVQIRCLSELDVQIKSSKGLRCKQQPRKIQDYQSYYCKRKLIKKDIV